MQEGMKRTKNPTKTTFLPLLHTRLAPSTGAYPIQPASHFSLIWIHQAEEMT